MYIYLQRAAYLLKHERGRRRRPNVGAGEWRRRRHEATPVVDGVLGWVAVGLGIRLEWRNESGDI